MIQKVIEGSASCGSAANFTMPTKAVKSAPTTMPESTIIKMEPDSPGRVRLTSITSSMAAVPESHGAHLNAGGREAKENRQDGPKGGASRNPQGIRGGQRISKKRLKRCAG